MKNQIMRIQMRPLLVFSFTFCLLMLANITSSFFVAMAQGNPNSPIVYQTNFDNLALGRTQPFPGLTGQGGWYRVLADGAAYSEIQNQISFFGNALHQHTGANVPPHHQTIDQVSLSRSLNGQGIITLEVDFYSATSNFIEADNGYSAYVGARGGPHPGFEIIGFVIGRDYSLPKNDGVRVGLATYSPQDNNIVPVPLTVGQHLAWNSWHNVKVVIDHTNNTYQSITVDGVKQNLLGFKPPHSTLDGINWVRGQQISSIGSVIIPLDGGLLRTDDDIYWDNLKIRVTPK